MLKSVLNILVFCLPILHYFRVKTREVSRRYKMTDSYLRKIYLTFVLFKIRMSAFWELVDILLLDYCKQTKVE